MDEDVDESLAALRRRHGDERVREELDALLIARDQTERLLRAIVDIGSELELSATLQRIVDAGKNLTDAPYGALGVRGPDGTIVAFLQDGVTTELVERIGHFPAGKGLLGVSLNEAETVRLDDVSTHPATVGFPEHHPRMRAFLGVPIKIGGMVFASLYLADDDSSRTFSEIDEMMARSLAAAASTAIVNAQLFERVTATAEWTKASREITTALLAGIGQTASPLQLIADRARELTGAEQSIVLVPPDLDLPASDVDTLVVSAAAGVNSELVLGQEVPIEGSTTGAVFRTAEPVITDSFRYPILAFTDVGERPAVVVPLQARDRVVGVIAVARAVREPPFENGHLELIGDFAGQAAMALTLATARDQARELMLVADRERIAHDLHDHVIQRLFSVGMDLQGTLALARSPAVANRISRTIDVMQDTINEIRATIFKLSHSGAQDLGLRQRIPKAVAELTENRSIATEVAISGPTTVVDDRLAEQAEAVVREAVSNAVRHSGATTLKVQLDVADEVVLEITDNGRGIDPAVTRRSGLANLRRRAEQVGGVCQISTPLGGGTQVRWAAPL
jgi:signal transduction histidine kinase